MKTIMTTAMLFAAPLAGFAQQNVEEHFVRPLEVAGQAYIELDPDYATISLRFSEEAGRSREAIAKIHEKADALLEGFEALPEGSVEASLQNIRINPIYEGLLWDKFAVTQSISLKITDMEVLADIVDMIADAKPESVSGIMFEIDERERIERELMAAAAEDARYQASTLVDKLGGRLGAPLEVLGGRYPQPMMDEVGSFEIVTETTASSPMGKKGQIMASPEKIRVNAEVWVRYEILPEEN